MPSRFCPQQLQRFFFVLMVLFYSLFFLPSLPFSPPSSSFSSAVCSPLSTPEYLINPWMKFFKINPYSVLYCVSGLCREVYCIIKLQKVRDIFVGIHPRILFSGRKLIHGYCKANELSARILEGGFVKWKQRSAKRNREEIRWRGKACVMRLSCF